MRATKSTTPAPDRTPGFRVRLPPAMLSRLNALVDRASGETRSMVVRRALREFLERNGR